MTQANLSTHASIAAALADTITEREALSQTINEVAGIAAGVMVEADKSGQNIPEFMLAALHAVLDRVEAAAPGETLRSRADFGELVGAA